MELESNSNSTNPRMSDDLTLDDINLSRNSLDMMDVDGNNDDAGNSRSSPPLPPLLSIPATLTDTHDASVDSPTFNKARSTQSSSSNVYQLGNFSQPDKEFKQNNQPQDFPLWASCWCPVRENLNNGVDSDDDLLMDDVDETDDSQQNTGTNVSSQQQRQQQQQRKREQERRNSVAKDEVKGFWQCCSGSR